MKDKATEMLKTVCHYNGVDFDEVSEEDKERFIRQIEMSLDDRLTMLEQELAKEEGPHMLKKYMEE